MDLVTIPHEIAIEMLEYFEDIYDPTPLENGGLPEMGEVGNFIGQLKKATGEK